MSRRSHLAFEVVGMVSSQVHLVLPKFLVEAYGWLHDVASGLGVDLNIMVVFTMLLHEGSDDEGGVAGHVGLDVQEDVVLWEHVLDVGLGGIKMGEDVGLIKILQVNPLAVLDLVFPQFLLDAVGVMGKFINNAYHTVDVEIFDEICVIKRIDPTEVKIALFWVLLI